MASPRMLGYLAPIVVALTGVGCARPVSIEGTYTLVRRELPDGGIMRPPDVVGCMTFSETYRNFNICWKDGDGRRHSVSYVATYSLSDKEYSEESIYRMVNDEISGEGLSYDFSRPSGSSPVSIEDGGIEFRFPLYDEPSGVFEGDEFTATQPGDFVDFWEKVD